MTAPAVTAAILSLERLISFFRDDRDHDKAGKGVCPPPAEKGIEGQSSQEIVNAKGKVKRVYRWYATPWENLRRLPGLAGHLKSDVTVEALDCLAGAQTDLAAATQMQIAKRKLFDSFSQRLSA